MMNQDQISQVIVDIRDTKMDGDTATVQVVTLDATNDGIFSSGWENKENALLEKVDGEWKITTMPYLFWSYEWFQPIK